MQWLRVEYLVFWSCSQEQPVSDYTCICCWLSLFKGILMFFPNDKYSIKTYTFASYASIIISQPEIYSSTNYINDFLIFNHNPLCSANVSRTAQLHAKMYRYFLKCCNKKVPDDSWCNLKYVAHWHMTLKCCIEWCISLPVAFLLL